MSGIPISGIKILPGLEAQQNSIQAPMGIAQNAIQPLNETGEVEKVDFMSLLNNFTNSVNELGNVAEDSGNAFLNGEDIDLHEVMIAGEESGIAFDLLLEIRNKLIEAYKDMIRMPI